LEFSKDDKRIALSHKAIYSKEEPAPAPAAAAAAPKKKSKSSAPKGNKDSEKSTLGDLEALSALKDKMEGDAKKPAKKPAAKKVAKEDKKEDKSEE
jgi:small subunit ribosomal protein S1